MNRSRLIVALSAFGMLGGVAFAQQNSGPVAGGNPPAVAPQGVGGSGAGSTQLFAVVNGTTGVVARGKGNSAGGGRLGVGTYDVRFGRSVLQCAYVVSVGGINFDTPSGSASATNRAGAANGVFVQTRNAAGTLTDLTFHIYIDC